MSAEEARVKTERDTATKAIRGTINAAVGAAAVFAVRFGGNLVLARLLVPADFGLFALAAAYAEVLGIAGAFSFPQSLVQLDERTEGLLDTAFWMTLAAAAALTLLAVAAYPLVRFANGPAVATLFLALAAGRVVTGASACFEGILQQRFRFGGLAALQTASVALGVALAVALARAGAGAVALVARDLWPAAVVAATLYAYFRVRGHKIGRTFNPRTARDVWRLGRSLLLVRGSEVAYQRADQLLVGWLLGPAQLGLYSQARYLASLPNAGLGPATTMVGLRTFSVVRGDPARQAQAFSLLQYFLANIMVPLGVFVSIAPERIITLAYGPPWIDAAPSLRIFSLWMVVLPLFESEKTFLVSAQRWAPIRWSYVLQIVVFAAASGPLAHKFGAPGIALAIAIAILCGLFLLGRAVRTEIALEGRIYLGPVAAGCVALLAGHAATAFMAPLSAATLALAPYVTLLWLFDRARLRAQTGYVARRLGLAR